MSASNLIDTVKLVLSPEQKDLEMLYKDCYKELLQLCAFNGCVVDFTEPEKIKLTHTTRRMRQEVRRLYKDKIHYVRTEKDIILLGV